MQLCDTISDQNKTTNCTAKRERSEAFRVQGSSEKIKNKQIDVHGAVSVVVLSAGIWCGYLGTVAHIAVGLSVGSVHAWTVGTADPEPLGSYRRRRLWAMFLLQRRHAPQQ